MISLRHYLDTNSDLGPPFNSWTVHNKPTGHEAVLRGSGDNYYISHATFAELSGFACDIGSVPELGIISGISVHIRHRATAVGGGQIQFTVLNGGAPIAGAGTETPTTSWTDSVYRSAFGAFTGLRYTSADLNALEAAVAVTVAPTAGELQVSEMWLELEWALSPERYDPTLGAIPTAIPGDMIWNTTGASAGGLVLSQLRILDTSAVTWRAYWRAMLEYGEPYVTELAARLTITTTTTGPAFIFRIALVDDATHQIDLCAFLDAAGDEYIGIATGGADRNDPAAYLATYQLDWTADHHYRIVIDRDDDLDNSQNVQVLVDYAATPVIEVNYFLCTGSTGSAEIQFGSGSAALPVSQSTTYIDFYDWWHYKKQANWRYWYPTNVATNEVQINSTDASIVTPITITPPGITTGQSNTCCVLDVNDLTDECSIRTYFPVPDVFGTYNVAVDYRMATAAEDAILIVQRTSDHYYWNNGGAAWQAAAASVTLVTSATRTRVTAMTNIQTATPDNLIITVRNDVGAGAAHEVYLYKVDVRE